MANTKQTVEILNDLVEINNDRINGYEKAFEEAKTKYEDLKPIFFDLIRESQNCKMALSNEVLVLKGEVDTGTTSSGKIYRTWMDISAAFTGNDRKTILANCEFGEDAAQKAYKTALSEELPVYIHEMIAKQQTTLRASHDKIKTLRDMHS